MLHHGRQTIYTDAAVISASNLIDELKEAVSIHQRNVSDIDFLYNYYRGVTPIMHKVNDVREDINNKVVENRADEIVTFKTGYLLGEPIQYVSRRIDESVSDMILKLNGYMAAEDKQSHDNDLARWMHICGVAYRFVLPDAEADVEEDDAPFEIMTPHPRDAFVVYSSGPSHKPIMGVIIVRKRNGTCSYNVYTPNEYFLVDSGFKVAMHKSHVLGAVPVIEYTLNIEKQGAFEKVMSLLDALNLVQSERVDDVEQFVKSFMALMGCEMDEQLLDTFKRLKMICLPEGADVKMVSESLQQSDTQVLKDDIYNSIIEICGMPNRNGGSSTSDTGAAVMLRDGWQTAETNAQNTELRFKKSEKDFMKLVLRICRDKDGSGVDLKLSDVDIKFTRRNYEDIVSKANVLVQMLANDKIHPKYAYEKSGMFADPEQACKDGLEWFDEHSATQEVQPDEVIEVDDNVGGEQNVS